MGYEIPVHLYQRQRTGGGRQRRIFQQFHWLRCGFAVLDDFQLKWTDPWFILFVLATTIVVIFGVEKGIEKASRIMMPILAILAVVIAIYSLTIPGALQA